MRNVNGGEDQVEVEGGYGFILTMRNVNRKLTLRNGKIEGKFYINYEECKF